MDMRTLKVGQRVYIDLNEATVMEMAETYVRIGIANWDGSDNGHTKTCAADFYYDGPARVWEWVDGSCDCEYTVVNEDNIYKFCIGKYTSFSYTEAWKKGHFLTAQMNLTQEQKFSAIQDKRTGVYKDKAFDELVAMAYTPDPVVLGRCACGVPDAERKEWERHAWGLLTESDGQAPVTEAWKK
jgi:hypothetical protein